MYKGVQKLYVAEKSVVCLFCIGDRGKIVEQCMV